MREGSRSSTLLVFRMEGLSLCLSLIPGRRFGRPDPGRIQKILHTSRVGSVDVVGGLVMVRVCM